ncbi:SO2930 family diheme c-type cytochrome [Rhodocista pekingensis]|uniref:SO2930 family diheme c-type cytochrome n=1 Tax=Rhodocista pekingensis TaxID=201185 RepID=A0ABW2L1D9_9PROT
MRARVRAIALAAALLAAAGCDGGNGTATEAPAGPSAVVFHAGENPERLSDWGVLPVAGGRLTLAGGVVPYDLATPLFTDHAGKLRTIWMPAGTSARYDAAATFDFPVGTVITKTFYYPRAGAEDGLVAPGDRTAGQGGAGQGGFGLDLSRVRLIETRVLVRRESGWAALPYLWDADQKDARLHRTGAVIPLTLAREDGSRERFAYVMPNANQCAGCHVDNLASRAFQPIGPKARHLNVDFDYPGGRENQLRHLAAAGYLTGAPEPAAAPRNADWRDTAQPLEARARAYLDINCGHCHNPAGAAKTSGLHLGAEVTDARELGFCKPPVAAGQGTGGHRFDIVPGRPHESILVYRLASVKPGAMMPELGRTLAHDQGVALIRDWVAAMAGRCD